MWQEIVSMFSNSGIISAVCLLIGMVFCVVEFCIPGFGIFGIIGLLLLAFSVVFQIIIGATVTQIFLLIGVVVVIILILVLCAIKSAKSGLISKSPLVESSTALPNDFADNKKNYGYLLNKYGVTFTVCKPVGKAEISGKTYQVISTGKYLQKGTNIQVVEVDGNSIFIKTVDKEK